MCDLKIWPNVPPDVKYHSTTLGKIEPTTDQEQILSGRNTTTSSTTAKPPVIQWNDESEYPILDELSRISKVGEEFFCLFRD